MIKSTHSVNPYVRLSYGDSKQQTSVTRGSLLPLWNESFIFPFEEFANFKLTVYNKVAFGRDEVVGE
jgi:Ca2+-dependent lipid-binding protein